MLGKALTTAVLLAATLAAAPQAQAGAAFSTTIVIRSIPTVRTTHQGHYWRSWHRHPNHHWGFARHHGFKRHAAKHHRPRHHAAPAHWGGRHSRRHHPHNPGHRSRH